ncbi:MAG: NACHT domain-containing protein [Candidatus Binataceae bacterium]
MAQRDNFSESTKLLLAKKVGFLCSHPECKRPTVGAALGKESSASIGEAAHITAAAPGGPRYDPSLSHEQRRSYSNGIWMCRNHAKQVDSDETHFTRELLQEWKQKAEQDSFEALTSGTARLPLIVEFNLEDEVLERLGLSKEEDLEKVTARLRQGAISDLEAFERAEDWPSHPISLSLRTAGGSLFDVSACLAGIEATCELSFVAPPGTGKSTTLLQLTEKILSSEKRVAVFVPLNEWSSQGGGILASLTHRPSFRDFSERNFDMLAAHGWLAIVLDGWNELDANSRKEAIVELKRLRRYFPLLQIAISTRRQAMDLPLSGPTIEIQPLSEKQQLEIAKATSGEAGEALLDRAWRLPGLRALVSIPLYLQALLKASPSGELPTTKEEVLRLFVTEHERSPQKAEVLHTELDDLQEPILTGLAIELTTSANTVISESRARSVIAETTRRLTTEGKIEGGLQPSAVIDTLVGHHALVRRGNKEISFLHQQIQEWYCSFQVEKLVLLATAGNASDAAELRVNVLDVPRWEEAILFACERLSRRDQTGIEAVADSILESLKIDPMLAAEMIYRSAPPVWERIKSSVIGYVDRWHTKGKVDRAVRFMITTGKADFAPLLWPLIANENSQVYLAAFRAAEPFRLSVLGEGVGERLSKLSDGIREHVLAQFAWEGGIDGMELAAEVAKNDPIPEVRCAVLDALEFRGCDRLVREVLKTAPEAVWMAFAQKWHAREIGDPKTTARLTRVEESIIDKDPNPLHRLGRLVLSEKDAEAPGAIGKIISASDFPIDKENAHRLLFEATKRWPKAVASSLVDRLANGLAIPYGSDGLLMSVPIVDDGPIAAIAVSLESPSKIADEAMAVVGPKSVGTLIDQLLALGAQVRASGAIWTQEQAARAHRLRDLIAFSRQASFIEAWLVRSKTEDPHSIATLTDLVAFHGRRESDRGKLRLEQALRSRMTGALNQHAKALMGSPKTTRHHLSELARAIGRLAATELTNVVDQLCKEDMRRWHEAREARRQNPSAASGNDAAMSYTNVYSGALAAIGDDNAVQLLKSMLTDPQYGHAAALALRQIWSDQQPAAQQSAVRLHFGPDFSQVKSRREVRLAGHTESCAQGQLIFAVAEDMAKPERSQAEQRHALALATVAFTMPYADKTAFINLLLASNISLLDKRRLLTALVIAGEIVPADLVLAAIKAFFEAAKQKPWMLNETGLWELKEWLQLLPFTDRPAATLEALDLLPKNLIHRWDLRGVLSSLANAPDPEALRILEELGRRDPDLLGEYQWVEAVLARTTDSAYLMLFDLFGDSKLAGGKKVEAYYLARQLSEVIKERPHLRDELLRRYDHPKFDLCNELIGQVLAESPDERVVLAMVRNYTKRKRAFDRLLEVAIEGTALGRRPAVGWQGAYEMYRVPVPKLRWELFAMAAQDCDERRLAAACLERLDQLRDKYGYAESEPRHPDITKLS